MAEILQQREPDPVIQFSIFLDNKVGRLDEFLELLARHEIHIAALTVQDNTESSILRLIVNYPDETRRLLREHGHTFTTVRVVAVEIESPRRILSVTKALHQAEINIHYVYPFVCRPLDHGALAISVEDNDLAGTVLSSLGLKVLTQRDIAR